MKLKNMFAVAAIVCVSASTASAAGSNVYITGSSAFRSALMSYLRSKLTLTRAVFDKSVDTSNLANSVDASSFIVMSGKFNGASTVTTFYLSFTGSVSGVRDLSGPVAQTFPTKPADFDSNASYLLGTASPFGGVKGTTKDSSGNLTSASFTATPDIGFSDVFQESTVYTTNTLSDKKVAVLPFVWITAPGGSAAGITNMTPQIAQTLFKTGTLSLAHFTGASADASKTVYAVGRTDDSGTRLTAMAEVGVGVSAGLHQYFPVNNPVTSYSDQVNSGYISGSDLSTAMKSVTTAANGLSVAYVSVGDAESTTNASTLSHNGVAYTTTLSGASSSAADTADIPLVTQGKYTFWGYEHMFPRADTALTGDAATVLTDLTSNLETGFTSSRKVIRLDAMQCERTTDGDIVNHY